MKFLVDESTGKRLAELLAKKYDTKFSGDALRGATDEEVLEFAERDGRILITDDKDFGRLVFMLRRPSTGVILLRTATTNAEERFRILLKVLKTINVRGKFIVVRGRQGEDKETVERGTGSNVILNQANHPFQP